MKLVIDEYNELYADFDYSSIDLSAIEKHINNISSFASITNSCLAIYDTVINKPVYMSDNYKNIFNIQSASETLDEYDSIHPDDYNLVLKSSIITLRYFNTPLNGSIKDHVLIRKYRANLKTGYFVINEQLQPIEYDKNGHVWLAMTIIEISPSQSPPYKFEFKVVNNVTGQIIQLNEDLCSKAILSYREIEILRLVEQGFLSKEISDKLFISVHTVNTHRQRILEKLRANSSMEAVKRAYHLGII